MALTTLPKLKDLLGVTNTAQDVQLGALLAAADTVVKVELDRDLEKQQYTEFYSGNGTRAICLRQTPVWPATVSPLIELKVWQDFNGYFGKGENAFDSAALLQDGKDYVLDVDKAGTLSHSGILWKINGDWAEIKNQYTPGRVTQNIQPAIGSIKVQYTAGYDPIPEDIQFAVALIVAQMRHNVKRGFALQSERLRDYSYALQLLGNNPFQEAGTVSRILRRYRKVPW